MSKGDVDRSIPTEDEKALRIAQQRIRKMDEESNKMMQSVSADDKKAQQGAA